MVVALIALTLLVFIEAIRIKNYKYKK